MKSNLLKALTLAALLALPAGESFADSGSKTNPCYLVTKTLNVDSGCTQNIKSGGTFTAAAGSTVTLSGTNSITAPTITGGLTVDTITASGLANLSVLQQDGLEVPPVPDGRLSLSSSLPVPTSDITAATTIYYLPYVGQNVPIYNGTHWLLYDITASGLSMGLSTTNMPTTQVYDIYAVNISGTTTLCAMYWGGNTSRSSSAGGKSGTADARVVQQNGVWVNKTAIATSNCYGGASGTTAVVIPANQGTLLGSIYTSANGQTQFTCKPSAAAGGSANILGISNAYNRVQVSCTERDSTTSFTYNSTSWAKLDGNANNSITFLDTLQQTPIKAVGSVIGANASIGDCAAYGIDLDSQSATPNVVSQGCAATSTLANNYNEITAIESYYPQMGLHYIQAMDAALIGGTATYDPVAGMNSMTLDYAY